MSLLHSNFKLQIHQQVQKTTTMGGKICMRERYERLFTLGQSHKLTCKSEESVSRMAQGQGLLRSFWRKVMTSGKGPLVSGGCKVCAKLTGT